LRFFGNFQKLPKVNNRPIGENSPDLVTLAAEKSCFTQMRISTMRERIYLLAMTQQWLGEPEPGS
jgi:hypothetical protein